MKISVPEGNSSGSSRGSIAARRQCKAGLINIIFHNYRMMRNGLDDFVPVIFNIDLKKMFDRSPIDKSSRTTSSELEVLRKLCTDPTLPDDFREMARRSIKFVQVEETTYRKPALRGAPRTTVTKFALHEMPAPWEDPGYAAHRAAVKAKFLAANPGFVRPHAMPEFGWRDQLGTFLDPDMGFIPEPVAPAAGMAPAPGGAVVAAPIPLQQQAVDPVGAS